MLAVNAWASVAGQRSPQRMKFQRGKKSQQVGRVATALRWVGHHETVAHGFAKHRHEHGDNHNEDQAGDDACSAESTAGRIVAIMPAADREST